MKTYYDAQIKELNQKVNLGDSKTSSLESKVNSNKANAESKITNLESKVNNNKGDADSKISGLESKVNSNKNTAESKISGLESKVDNNKVKADNEINKVKSTANNNKDVIDTINDRDLKPNFFSVYKKGADSSCTVKKGSTVTYTDIVANQGGGMDINTGIYKAPRTGVYSFSFAGQSFKTDERTNVNVLKNNEHYLTIVNYAEKNYYNIAYSWMMKLSAGDEVKLKMASNDLQCKTTEHIYFNGEWIWHGSV